MPTWPILVKHFSAILHLHASCFHVVYLSLSLVHNLILFIKIGVFSNYFFQIIRYILLFWFCLLVLANEKVKKIEINHQKSQKNPIFLWKIGLKIIYYHIVISPGPTLNGTSSHSSFICHAIHTGLHISSSSLFFLFSDKSPLSKLKITEPGSFRCAGRNSITYSRMRNISPFIKDQPEF